MHCIKTLWLHFCETDSRSSVRMKYSQRLALMKTTQKTLRICVVLILAYFCALHSYRKVNLKMIICNTKIKISFKILSECDVLLIFPFLFKNDVSQCIFTLFSYKPFYPLS